MNLAEIRKRPTSVNNCHESILRAYHVVQKVRELLERRTPPEVLVELIDDLMDAPHSEHDPKEMTRRCLSCGRDRMVGDLYCKLHAAVRDLTAKGGAQCFVVRLADKQFATFDSSNKTFYWGSPPQLVQVLEEHGDEIIVRVFEDHCKCPPPYRAHGNDTTPFCDRCNKEINRPVSEIEAWRHDQSQYSFDRKVAK